MRLYFKLSSTSEILPFDYQYNILGKLHNWLGENEYHDKMSLYSFGWLSGGENSKKGLSFKSGAIWFLSFWQEDLGKKIIFNALKNSEFIFGMKVIDITIKETPDFSNKELFSVSSPVLVRNYTENGVEHLISDNPKCDELMTKTMQRKLREAKLDDDIIIKFNRDYHKPKTKLIKINGIENRANLCPVIIEGNPESIKFAWNVGVGHSTGSGFGALN
ncbi:MAG: CRISPR-associated endoribonuclease Cas6 [Candidatus Kapabacteria bacterium]|nr:CRISPR-associated endoribonuclease Cas6 [Ignavibacteriota bacterium]MCW5883405.1 CRISPR-associated endoribonuclease Cas6 [Candidatus Kapabacteria bacterium]